MLLPKPDAGVTVPRLSAIQADAGREQIPTAFEANSFGSRVARLRIGDIEIDGHQVHIGASVGTPSATMAPPPQIAPPPNAGGDAFSVIPGPPWLLGAIGLGTAFLGVIFVMLTDGTRSIEHFFTRGAFLVPLGAGLVLFAGLKVLAARGISPFAPNRKPDAATRDRLAAVRRVLAARRRHTVESISREIGWPESDVVRALGWLQESEEVREELDTDTGHFFYAFTPRPMDLATRLRHISSGD